MPSDAYQRLNDSYQRLSREAYMRVSRLEAKNAALKAERDAARAEVERLRGCVPTTWLDPIMTGPDAVFVHGRSAEENVVRVLLAVRERMLETARGDTDAE